MAALFGIHIGNTSACLAFCKDDDRVEVIANDTGDRLTPTTVQWTPTQSLVGRSAILEQFRHATSTVFRCKQLLNEDISTEELDQLRQQVPFKIHKTSSSVKYEILCDGKQHQVSVKEMVLAIFKKLHGIATTSVSSGVELQAVLSVPSYFSTKSIQSIQEIAEKSGFSVLQVVDEASVAVLAAVPPHKSGICVVCRVGGVSLDIVVMSIIDGMYTVLSSVHRASCGGRYITEKLRDFLATEFSRQYKGQEIAERGKFKLEAVAETAKQILSIQNSALCSAESIGGGFDLNCSVSRPRLDNIVATLLPVISEAIQDALKQAQLTADQVESVVLCGGTTKIPRVQEQVRSLLPRAELFGTASPDEVMAVGAAIQARLCSKLDVEAPTSLTLDIPVTAATVSLKILNDASEELALHEVAADTVLPVSLDSSLPEGGASVDVSVDSESIQVLPLKAMASLDLHIDREGVMKIQLPPALVPVKS